MTTIAPPGPPSFRYRLLLWGWTMLLALGEPLVWRYFRRRAAADPDYMADAGERRGRGRPFEADLWVHAVSMGEMRSAAPIVRLALDAGFRVVTTHATPAGRRAAEDAFPEALADGRLAVRYAPLDRPGYWRDFFEGCRPRVGLAMEIEIWPWMLEAAARAGVPLVLANSQIPGRSLPRARWLARVFGHPAARAAAVFAKSEAMAARFRVLGADRVEAMGETRFDIPPPDAQIAAGKSLAAALGRRPVVTFASVVAGEEGIYETAARRLIEADPRPLVIWVPRAPEAFAGTAERLRRAGFAVAARSAAFDGALAPVSGLDGIDILVGDTMGEMFFYLEPAGAVVVGGGFLAQGAHNVIEPLALGKPVITGPSVWTIEFPGTEAAEAGVLTICRAPEALADEIFNAMVRGGAEARAFHARYAGASARIFGRIRPLLDGRGE